MLIPPVMTTGCRVCRTRQRVNRTLYRIQRGGKQTERTRYKQRQRQTAMDDIYSNVFANYLRTRIKDSGGNGELQFRLAVQLEHHRKDAIWLAVGLGDYSLPHL